MWDPRPGQRGALGRYAASQSCGECEAQTANTAEALARRGSLTRQLGCGGAHQHPGRAGPDLSARATASPHPRRPKPRGRHPQAAGSARQSHVRSHGQGPRGAGAPGSGQWLPVPSSLQPLACGVRGSPPRTTAPPRVATQSRAAGQPPVSCPGTCRGARGRPAPSRGGRLRELGGAGTTFRRSSAPRPLSSRGGTLRAAPVAAGYSGHCEPYKSSLCGAILSLSVCGSCASLALGAESEGRRRRRKVRGAAPVPAEPPPQAEDGRTPAAGGACSPEVLGRSFPYPSGAAPAPSSEPNFVAGARSRRRLGTGPGAARRPGVGSGGRGAGWGRRGGGGGGPRPGGRRAAARAGFRSRCSSGPRGRRWRGGGDARASPGA